MAKDNKFLVSFSLSGIRIPGISLAMFDGAWNLHNCYKNSNKMKEGNQGTVVVDEKIYTISNNVLFELDLGYNILREKTLDNYTLGHGMKYNDGKLYIVMCSHAVVLVVDIKTFNIVELIQHDSYSTHKEAHVNSVDVYDDATAITVHNLNRAGYGYIITPNGSRYNVGGELNQPHDLTFSRFHSDTFFVNNSLDSEVKRISVPIEYSWTLKVKGYTRGLLELNKNTLIIGSTERSKSPGCRKRIYVLNSDTGRILREIELPDMIGRPKEVLSPEINSITKVK